MRLRLALAGIAAVTASAPTFAQRAQPKWQDVDPVAADIHWLDVLSTIEGRPVARNLTPATYPFTLAPADGAPARYLMVGGYAVGSFSTAGAAELLVLTRSYSADELPALQCDISILAPVADAGKLQWSRIASQSLNYPLACGVITETLHREGLPDAVVIEGCEKSDARQGRLKATISLDSRPPEVVGLPSFQSDAGCAGPDNDFIDLHSRKNHEIESATWRLGEAERVTLLRDAQTMEAVSKVSPSTRGVWQRSERQRVLLVPDEELEKVKMLLAEQQIEFEVSRTLTLCPEPGGGETQCEVNRIEARY
jgi:hypothetical protein